MFGDHATARDDWADVAESSALTPRLNRASVSRVSIPNSYYLSAEQAAPWLGEACRTLVELTRLPRGWDSYGGRPLSSGLRAAAEELIRSIASVETPRPSIVPTADGSVQLEWHERDIDLELRLRSQSVYELFFEDATGAEPTIERELRSDLTPLRDALAILRTR